MAHPRELQIEHFTYPLPEERIARYPLPDREGSKLLLYKGGRIGETLYSHIAEHLPPGALLVFNNSRVVEARLLFQKPTGGIIEIFALEPHEQYADITAAMNETGRILYKCLIGGAGKWKHGMVLHKEVQHEGQQVAIEARITERRSDCFVIELQWTPTRLSFANVLHLAGQMPIPPYLHREAEESDRERYQTVYATTDGSVAAPTAGLHFTPRLLGELKEKGHPLAYTTLHVGAGTFMPVKSATMAGHEMHAEYLEADMTLLEQLQQAETVVAVGTTAMRTLESLYWMGVKAHLRPDSTLADLEMQQWEVYDALMEHGVPTQTAMQALVGWLRQQGKRQLVIRTRIIIAPGYRF
ncbi:MAG TPA: S-adenosylmethionine:tRNA ribosyltransferase-isomerase, partial [Phnomibacter sp.]|nr:S-adenosylmethionine:tRNA ribosyltransferase-isomerase [Phnomibacter sp.]